ncbi:hypothetical protein OO17_02045 [Rhodopseudomonas palustris]|uniref:Uncharacterized protein n=2 Tax=Nitrobacteraceae TaxID=41294 RepID=A0A0D7F464_RHOPL|nr:hypothetical protein OO17_02045 [Rhodopseudomonas palustris]
MVTRILKGRPDTILLIAPTSIYAALVALSARCIGARSWLHLREPAFAEACEGRLFAIRPIKTMLYYLETLSLMLFDRVSTISPQMRRELQSRGVDARKTYELRDWIDLSAIEPGSCKTRIRRQLGLNEAHFLGLVPGASLDQDALDMVVSAAMIFSQRQSHIHLVIYGKAASVPTETPNLHLLDLPPAPCSELLATADFHIVQQNTADSLLPPLLGEILASNRPAIAIADSGTCFADEVEDVGLIVAPRDVLGLVESIGLLDDERALTEILGNNARERALERWSRPGIIHRLSLELSDLVSDDLLGRSTRRKRGFTAENTAKPAATRP